MNGNGIRRAVALWTGALLLAACGGGGGDGAPSTGTREPLPYLSTDINPAGPRQDVQSQNYFPAAVGDRWNYDVSQNGQKSTQQLIRAVTAVTPAGEVAIAETYQGSTDTQIRYVKTADGSLISPLTGSTPQAVLNIVGRILEYPALFYPVGAERVVVRQGSWGSDLDGDGVAESFRFEFRQTLTGFETLTVAGLSIGDVAHFRNVVTLKVQPSDLRFGSYTVTTVENAWWAPGIGLMRYDRRADGSDGDVVVSPFSLTVTGGVVAGETLFVRKPDGVVIKVPLLHNALVYDASRGVYYASVPASVAGNGNRIAIIDATSGAVSYSVAAVGSEPAELAVSADGSALYVGLNGTGEIAKLALPGMAEQWRAAIPLDSFSGPLSVQRISVSPLDPDVVAVSLVAPQMSWSHAGVLFIRAGLRQSPTTGRSGSSNLITFDGGGQFLYGYNIDSTEFGLRRFAVLTDSLHEEAMVQTGGNFAFASFDWKAGRLVIGTRVYRTPNLSYEGAAPSAGGICVWILAGQRLVCASGSLGLSPFNPALDVVDGSSFHVLASPVYQLGFSPFVTQIVAGPAGSVALRMDSQGPSHYRWPRESIWLFKSPALDQ
jgi:DNA-binding beta-propeller fold protein YncE